MLLGKVYMITHNPTGRMYIGRSEKVERRLKTHFSLLEKGKHPVEDMQKDYEEHGNDYTISILGEDTGCNNLEIKMMDKYNSTTRGIGYNYNDPHVMNIVRINQRATPKTELNRLIKKLDDAQIQEAYTLLSERFKEQLS